MDWTHRVADDGKKTLCGGVVGPLLYIDNFAPSCPRCVKSYAEIQKKIQTENVEKIMRWGRSW
jgi:hypothetical protein